MTRHYDTDRPVGDRLMSPRQIAESRAQRMYDDPADRARFLDSWSMFYVAEARGKDTWHLYRKALAEGDSIMLAGYIEGVASHHRATLGRKGMVL